MRAFGKMVAMSIMPISLLLAIGGGAQAASIPAGPYYSGIPLDMGYAYNRAMMDSAGPEFGFFKSGGAQVSVHRDMRLRFDAGLKGIDVTPQSAFFGG